MSGEHLHLDDLERCRYDGDERPRIVLGRHLGDCTGHSTRPGHETGDCRGCQPCERPHCRCCGVVHVDLDRGLHTCPGCLADIRSDLTLIPRLAAKLPPEAVRRGVDSEAFHLNGPTADPQAWRQRGQYGHRYDAEARLGDLHPLWVLGTWELMVVEHRGLIRTAEIDVASAATFLADQLAHIAHDPDFGFEDLPGSLRACRRHLERVVHDGEQVEEVAPCVTCERPISRTIDDAGEYAYRCEHCRRDLTPNEYRLAVGAAYRESADRLSIDDLAERLDVPPSTLRRWANPLRIQQAGGSVIEHPPLIRSCGQISGRKVYRVADAYAILAAGGDRRRGSTPNPPEEAKA